MLKYMIIALFVEIACIFSLQPLAKHLNFLDHPGGRKTHDNSIPVIGGIAMFLSFSVICLFSPVSLKLYHGLFIASSILVIVGALDDFYNLRSSFRLCTHFIVALALIFGGALVLNNLTGIKVLHFLSNPYWAIPITVIFVLANINAVNMIDGQDGLAGCVTLGQAALLFFLSKQFHFVSAEFLLLLVIFLLLGFLSFNMPLPWRKKASIFMGDAGSTFIAFFLVWLAIELIKVNPSHIKPVTIFWILAFPLFDLINVFFHRIFKKQSPMKAGRDHLHHILHAKGLNIPISTFLLSSFSIGLGILGLIFNYYKVAQLWQILALFITLLLYSTFVKLNRQAVSRGD